MTDPVAVRFTEEDFKRLKLWQSLGFQPHTAWELNEMLDLLNALLARLEAAEACINDPASSIPMRVYKRWEKAAGRE